MLTFIQNQERFELRHVTLHAEKNLKIHNKVMLEAIKFVWHFVVKLLENKLRLMIQKKKNLRTNKQPKMVLEIYDISEIRYIWECQLTIITFAEKRKKNVAVSFHWPVNWWISLLARSWDFLVKRKSFSSKIVHRVPFCIWQ